MNINTELFITTYTEKLEKDITKKQKKLSRYKCRGLMYAIKHRDTIKTIKREIKALKEQEKSSDTILHKCISKLIPRKSELYASVAQLNAINTMNSPVIHIFKPPYSYMQGVKFVFAYEAEQFPGKQCIVKYNELQNSPMMTNEYCDLGAALDSLFELYS